MTTTSDERRALLGEKIKALRVEQGLSREKLALMVGTNNTHLWSIETGRKGIGIDLLCRIADGLGVQVSDLINF